MLTLALAQLPLPPADVDAAVQQHAAAVRAAGARVVLFPELSLTGYDLARVERDAAAWFTVDDARLAPLVDACRETGATAVAGAAVRDGDRRLLAALRVEPDGTVAAHGKTHLHSGEHDLFDAAPPSAPFAVDGWPVALGVCYDLAHPAHAATAAAAGAELYLATVVYDEGDERRFDVHGAARAQDHRLVVAATNYAGRRPGAVSCGASAVWGPDGTVRARAGAGEEIVVVTVDRAELLAARASDARARRTPAHLAS